MAYDLLIKNGFVVDGTGAPGYHADIAVSGGKIAAIGKIGEGAEKIVDASDCVVSPGFIDPHTHYDAQICWDGGISPSPWHGVTSVVMGNCGVGIAPCKPELHEVAMRDLVTVEGIPYDVLNKGITWDWETFPQYLDAADRRNPAINLGFLAPLTPLRHYVMGEDSMERAATPEETQQIKGLLKEAMTAGALGFSTSTFNQHIGYGGRPLACRNASREELGAYANVLKELDKGAIEIALTKKVSVMTDEEYELLDYLLTESGHPVTFIAMFHRDDVPEACQDTLRKAAPLLARGAAPQTSPLPLTRELDLKNPGNFATFNCYRSIFGAPKEKQIAQYRDPGFRDAWREELKQPRTFSGNWERIAVDVGGTDAVKALEGRTIADIARERGKDGVDTLLDIALEDDLQTEFTLAFFNATVERIPELLNNPHLLIGLGDGGAHVDRLCDAGYATYLLGKWVREKQAMTLEHAIQRLTSQPAGIFGIKGRGRLQQGYAADIAIFDPATVGSSNRGEKRYDLPGGGKRYVMPSRGIQHTIVNGELVYTGGQMTEARPGRVIRS